MRRRVKPEAVLQALFAGIVIFGLFSLVRNHDLRPAVFFAVGGGILGMFAADRQRFDHPIVLLASGWSLCASLLALL